MQVTFKLSDIEAFHTRKVYDTIEMLGEIGGLFGILFSQLLRTYLLQKLYKSYMQQTRRMKINSENLKIRRKPNRERPWKKD